MKKIFNTLPALVTAAALLCPGLLHHGAARALPVDEAKPERADDAGVRLRRTALLLEAQRWEDLSTSLQKEAPAVLTAIVFPEVFMPSAQLNISVGNERLHHRIAFRAMQRHVRTTMAHVARACQLHAMPPAAGFGQFGEQPA